MKSYSTAYCYTVMREIKISFKPDSLNPLGVCFLCAAFFPLKSLNAENEAREVCVNVCNAV